MSLSSAYELRPETPDAANYRRLRQVAGLSPVSVAQAERAVQGAWAACHVVEVRSGTVVAMGRVIGDGAWVFQVVDMAVDPGHQRQGIGDAVLTWLLETVENAVPPGAYISLMADAPGRPLYRKHGFVESDRSVGMARRLGSANVSPAAESGSGTPS